MIISHGQTRGHSEDCIQDAVGSLRVLGHAFWAYQCPAQFMNMMNDLLGNYLDRFVLIFLDNILVYSANVKGHAEHLERVLQVLRKHQLYAKASKCEIFKHSVKFLG